MYGYGAGQSTAVDDCILTISISELPMVGTNSTHLRALLGGLQGNKKPRLSNEESFAAVEEFCMAVHDKWPNCLVQFEGGCPAACNASCIMKACNY